MRMIAVMVMTAALTGFAPGCTEQQQAKALGGGYEHPLADCEKVVNVTWKDDVDLWVLSRPFQAGEEPVTYTFTQYRGAPFVVFGNGRVVLSEHCSR